jgi:hypothetical protein
MAGGQEWQTRTDLGAEGGDGAGGEPLLEFTALVFDAVVHDDGRNDAETAQPN